MGRFIGSIIINHHQSSSIIIIKSSLFHFIVIEVIIVRAIVKGFLNMFGAVYESMNASIDGMVDEYVHFKFKVKLFTLN